MPNLQITMLRDTGWPAAPGAVPQTDYVGDCRQIGNVHFAVQSGYGAANQI